MPAAASATELRPAHRDHLDPGLAQQGVGVCVPVVPDDDAGREGDNVVAVVPLLALGLPDVAAGLDDAKRLQPEDLFDHVEQMASVEMNFYPALAVRTGPVTANLIGDLAIRRAQVAVAEGEHRV